MTIDEMTVELLANDDQDGLAALADLLHRATSGEIRCPACDSAGPHDDNGARRTSELSFCCSNCDEQFDAENA